MIMIIAYSNMNRTFNILFRIWSSTFWGLLYFISGGKISHWLGKANNVIVRNWNYILKNNHSKTIHPLNADELCCIIKYNQTTRFRAFGVGHSFNSSCIQGDVTVSLKYFNNIEFSVDNHYVTVGGGVELMALGQAMLCRGLAFPVIGSANTQKIGGVIATNFHSTSHGDYGFFHDYIEKLTFINGKGDIHTVVKGDPVFNAYIGSLGMLGICINVTFKTFPAKTWKKITTLVPRNQWLDNIESMLTKHKYMSLYIDFNTENDILHRWRPTEEPVTAQFRVNLLEWIDIQSYASGDILSLFPKMIQQWTTSTLTDLVYDRQEIIGQSQDIWSRQSWYQHQEIDFSFPLSRFKTVFTQFIAYVKSLQFVPATIIEIRFTRRDTTALLGPSFNDEKCNIVVWMGVNIVPAIGYEIICKKFEEIAIANGGNQHLGKMLFNDLPKVIYDDNPTILGQCHNSKVQKIKDLVAIHDPNHIFKIDLFRSVYSD
jgi:hypothetical protein